MTVCQAQEGKLPVGSKASQQWCRFGPYNEIENGSRLAPASLGHSGKAHVTSGKILSVSQTGFWDWEKQAQLLKPGVATLKDIEVIVSIPDLTATGVAAEDLRLIGWDGNSWTSLGDAGASGTAAGSTLRGTLADESIKTIGIGSVSKALPVVTDVQPSAALVSLEKRRAEKLFRAYPNPTTGAVYLTLNENKGVELNSVKGIESIRVHGLNGQSVAAGITGGKNAYVVNFPQVPNGNYLIVITRTDGTTETHSVIYQK